MKKLLLVAAMTVIAPANAASLADSVCADLRSQAPTMRGPIAVTCHYPISQGGHFATGSTYFRCNPLDQDGVGLTPVDAETSDEGCRHPFR